MKKHVLRAIDGAPWATREAKLKAEAKIESLTGNFVGTDMFFNYTFLQERYGRVNIFIYIISKEILQKRVDKMNVRMFFNLYKYSMI